MQCVTVTAARIATGCGEAGRCEAVQVRLPQNRSPDALVPVREGSLPPEHHLTLPTRTFLVTPAGRQMRHCASGREALRC